MATRRFTINKVVDAVIDSDCVILDGESSEADNGKDIYAYMGDSAIDRELLHEETKGFTTDIDEHASCEHLRDSQDVIAELATCIESSIRIYFT